MTNESDPTALNLDEPLDRADPKAADLVIRSLCPGDLRSMVLEAITSGVTTANAINTSSWSITLDRWGRFLRLNIGKIFVFGVYCDRVYFSHIYRNSQDGTDTALEQGEFKSIPGVGWRELPYSAFQDEWPALREDYLAAVTKAAAHRTPYYRSHSAGVVDYLEEVAGSPLPRPEHPKVDLISASQINDLVDLVRSSFPEWDGCNHPPFREDEIDYKQEAAALARELFGRSEFRRLIDEGQFEEVRERIDKLAHATNLLYLGTPSQGDAAIIHQPDVEMAALSRELFELLHGDGESTSRLARWADWVDSTGSPNKWTFPTYFLFLLHPESEMFVKPTAMTSFLGFVGMKDKARGRPDPAVYGRILRVSQAMLEGFAEYDAEDMIDVQSVMWVCASATKRTRYWKIAPGAQAKFWEKCKREGYISLGWDELEDIGDIDRKEFDLRNRAIKEKKPDWKISGAEQTWRFATEVKEGDRIVANRGISEIVGIGTVIGPYYFEQDEPHRHRVAVEWDATGVIPVNQPGWRRTLIELTEENYDALVAKEPPPPPPKDPRIENTNPAYPLEKMASETGFERKDLRRWVTAIERKGQAVLYGPPGTGKTFLAERIAKHLIAGGNGITELVQFHPAYAYEDFIQGIRPAVRESGDLSYEMVQGRFIEFCRKAESKTGTSVLIVDEINRANLARVFGELMYLLEYRGATVPLAGGGSFSIPDNIRIVGTMNTADRSIALVDHALRRRFAFIYLRPNFAILRKFHRDRDFDVESLIEVLEEVNLQIGDPHYEVGISFFLKSNLDKHIEDIWRMEIEPYLEEFFFDRKEKAERFQWNRIQSRLTS